MNEYHGDEPEQELDYLMQRAEYEDEHADDYKYEDL